MNEEKQEIMVEEQPQENGVDIVKIVEELKGQGLEIDAIYEALNQMLKEGKIVEADLEKAKQLLEEEDKKEASKMFGVDIM